MKAMKTPLFTKRLPICNYRYLWLNFFWVRPWRNESGMAHKTVLGFLTSD
jgi:hypothetical protein